MQNSVFSVRLALFVFSSMIGPDCCFFGDVCLHQEMSDARVVAFTYTVTVGRGQHTLFYVSPKFGRETHTLCQRTQRLSPEEFRDESGFRGTIF